MFPTERNVDGPVVPAGLTLAPLGRRVGGLLLDQLICVVPVIAVALGLGLSPGSKITDGQLLAISIGSVSVAFVYETLMVGFLGRTVGKLATGTRVVRSTDGGRVGWSAAVMRALVPLAAGAVPKIGVIVSGLVYTLAFVTPTRQGLHDRAAGTLVVLHVAVPGVLPG